MTLAASAKTKVNVAISWAGLPAYAAFLIRAGIKKLNVPVAVIGTSPGIPVKNLEKILGQDIYWIDNSKVKSWSELDMEVPDVFFQAGYIIPSFCNLGKEVRNNGGKVVAIIDNCRKHNIRQLLGAVKFRLFYRKCFAAVWVPGKSATELLSFFGMESSKIYNGLYGADPECFSAGPDLAARPKRFIFVGQFIPRKGISTLVKAFKIFHKEFPDWEILMYGAGECRHLLDNCPGIKVYPFAQSPQIAEAFKQARFLVLPSLEDHWPLVVVEAAMVGCGLLLSDKTGNRHELLNAKNGFVFPARSVKELSEKLKNAASLSDSRLHEIYDESKKIASSFQPAQWAEIFCKIIFESGKQEK